jgi:hypothetical protein
MLVELQVWDQEADWLAFLHNKLIQFLLILCAEVLEGGGCFGGDV